MIMIMILNDKPTTDISTFKKASSSPKWFNVQYYRYDIFHSTVHHVSG